MIENKQDICDKLAETLKITRNCYDLTDIEYISDQEIAVLHFIGGDVHVNVAMDSGTAIIRDIMRALP